MIDNILNGLDKMYPNAQCELEYNDGYQLLIAVMLSAQTTDKRVNEVTRILFKKYPNPIEQAVASFDDVKAILHPLGLWMHKVRYLLAIADLLVNEYDGIVPNTFDELISLPGIGRKTANVVLAVGFGIPAMPVDTHVFRVAKRLGICQDEDVLKTEKTLCDLIPKDKWIKVHHQLIHFGRYTCLARNPKCSQCVFNNICKKGR